MTQPKGPSAQGEGQFSFKWFAQQPFYQAVNAYLLDQAGLQPGQQVVELACGTGGVTRMILEKLRGARESLVIAIDSSAAALREAMDSLRGLGETVVHFVQGRVEELTSLVRGRVDAVIFCNGIHYISDKVRLVQQVREVLRPGGIFAFNTSFFVGAHPPETEAFYRRWMLKAVRLLRARYGLRPEPRIRVEARRQLTPDQYRALLEGEGFRVRRWELRRAEMTVEGWVDISRYEDFVEGALPGVPLEPASQVLQETVRETFREMGLRVIPRNWLTVVAERAS